MTIQWFPGHMAKARRQIEEKLSLVDIVFELLDARIPFSSRNPMIDEIIGPKPRLILLNKEDMADQAVTREWVHYYREKGFAAIPVNSRTGAGTKQIVTVAQDLLKEKLERLRRKGIRPRAIRAMIVGIPNVGKSTLINRLAGRNIAKTGNVPGVTKAQQWIKVGGVLELLDTPGILWPKFEDQETGYKLALTGAIKDTILDLQDICVFGLRFLKDRYPGQLIQRYQLDEIPANMVELFTEIGKRRGCLTGGGEIDYDKVAELVIRDLRSVQFGPISFERPADFQDNRPSV